jgi:hypothetical protein
MTESILQADKLAKIREQSKKFLSESSFRIDPNKKVNGIERPLVTATHHTIHVTLRYVPPDDTFSEVIQRFREQSANKGDEKFWNKTTTELLKNVVKGWRSEIPIGYLTSNQSDGVTPEEIVQFILEEGGGDPYSYTAVRNEAGEVTGYSIPYLLQSKDPDETGYVAPVCYKYNVESIEVLLRDMGYAVFAPLMNIAMEGVNFKKG